MRSDTLIKKLIALLKEADSGTRDLLDRFYCPPFTFHRTYAGHLQAQDGAWSWWLQDAKGREICGSPCPATEIAKLSPEKLVLMYNGWGKVPGLWPVEGDEPGGVLTHSGFTPFERTSEA